MNSGFYIRVGTQTKLFESLTKNERNEYLNKLTERQLKRIINVLADTLNQNELITAKAIEHLNGLTHDPMDMSEDTKELLDILEN